jgi:C4-dicarboxylate transporter DctM subunit
VISSNFFGTTMITSTDSFPLMAIPLFILTGSLMEGGGLARRLVNFAAAFVGNFTGGYAMVAIVTCAFFGAISGSALATVAAIGVIVVPTMLEAGYDKRFSYGLICAAGCLGIIIPPSIPMVMYASTTEESIGTLFIGGFGPGILLTGVLMLQAYIMSRKRGYVGNGIAFSIKNVWQSFKSAVGALIIPIIILGGIYGGIFTPTEAAAVAVAYSAFAGRFIYKELTFKKFISTFSSTAITNATILFVLATATVFGRVLTIAQIPTAIVNMLYNVTNSPVILLLIMNLVLLIVGCLMDTVAAIIILAPMLMPLIYAYGINPIHFGLIMVLNLAIGLCTPPVGANLFVASSIGKLPFTTISKAVLPFLISLIVTLLLVTFVESITLFLPRLLGLMG